MIRASKDAGFTLVEVLIAIFIFSLISVGTMTTLTDSLQAKEATKDRLDEMADIEAARALMKSDFANLVLIPTRDNYGGQDQYMLSGGLDTLISFSRSGRVNPGGLEPRGDLQRVSYVFENGQLIRRALTQANPVPLTPTIDRIIFTDLTIVSVEFISGESSAPILQIPVTGPIPPLDIIEMTARFENGDELTQLFEVSL